MLLRNLSITRKLALGFGTVLVIVALSSAFSVYQVRQAVEIERVNEVSGNAQDALDQARGDLEAARASVRKLALTGADRDRTKAEANVDKLHKDIDKVHAIVAAENTTLTSDMTNYEDKVDDFLKGALLRELALGADTSTRPQAVTMIVDGVSVPFGNAVDAAFAQLSKRLTAWSHEASAQDNRAMHWIETVVIASSIASLAIGALMAGLIGRAIGRPLNLMTESMGRLAAGDHTVIVTGFQQRDEVGRMARAVQVFKEAAIDKLRLESEATRSREAAEEARVRAEVERAELASQQAMVVQNLADGLRKLADGSLVHRVEEVFATDYEQLRADFNSAVAKLQDAMQTVAANTGAIRIGSTEISSAADDLARRTEQQAASLEETAATLDEITATVKKTADAAQHAREIVSATKIGAERSSDVVDRAVAAMTAIEGSSQQISQIIGVIDEIAFQTNLLALNAGVEAARAGDAGRGFAVVASEVRALAQRSAEAAKEIKALISTSASQVNEGVGLVAETGDTLRLIATQVAEVHATISEIAASAQEQSTGLDQVNTAVNQMDQVTQQNAAMVEESTAASKSLAQEAEQLASLVGHFKISEGSMPRQSAVRGPQPRSVQPVVALKAVGRGGAARKPEPQTDQSWEEF